MLHVCFLVTLGDIFAPIIYNGVAKNNGTPKWIVYKGKPYEKMDDLGGKPTIFGNIHKDPYERTYRITRFVSQGNLPGLTPAQVSTWRFNFLFDPQKDFFAQVVLGG